MNRVDKLKIGSIMIEPQRIADQYWPTDTVPLVSIICTTYNHANYIRDAIEGFLMQETTFPVEVLIHDDASLDGTADIVKEFETKYPRIIRAIYQSENQYSKGNKPGKFLFNLARGKYIGICEGDDYWCHPRKLQMQFDLLEVNPKIGVVFSDVNIILMKKKTTIICYNRKTKKLIPTGNIINLILYENPFTTCTSLLRKTALVGYTQDPEFPFGDLQMWLHISLNYKFEYIDLNLASYRVFEESASHKKTLHEQIEFYLKSLEFCKNFAKRNNLSFNNIRAEKRLAKLIIKEIIRRAEWKALKEIGFRFPIITCREIVIEKILKPML